MEVIRIKHSTVQTDRIQLEPCVLALGVFDGVHKGHQSLVAEVKKIAQSKGLLSGVMTFDPNPKAFLFPERTPLKAMTPLPEKVEIFQNMGIDVLIVLEFNQALSRLSPEDFVEQYLLGLNCRHAVVGFDYRYGFKGQGNAQTLARDAKGQMAVTIVEPVLCGREKISSTAVRRLLADGDVASISQYLGRPYEVQGKVVHELHRPRGKTQINFMVSEDYLLPKLGDYLVEVEVDECVYHGRGRIIQRHGQAFVQFVPWMKVSMDVVPYKNVTIRWIHSIPTILPVAVER